MTQPRAPLVYALLFALLIAPSVLAQETGSPDSQDGGQTRFAEIAADQARKAAELTPYAPSAGERWTKAVHHEFLTDPSGLYPYFASVYSGGGFTLGAGYRQFYGDRTHWDMKGLYSLKNYKLFELSTDSWKHSGGQFDVHARVGWRDATQVAYYGLGMTTPTENAEFRMKQTYVGGDMQIRPRRIGVIGLGLTYDD